MKKFLLIALLFFSACAKSRGESLIRVLLSQGKQAVIQCPGSCRVSLLGSHIARSLMFPQASLRNIRSLTIGNQEFPPGTYTFRFDSNGIFLDGQKLSEEISIISPSPVFHLSFNGKSYRGSLLLQAKDQEMQVINLLPLEEYLYGVVGGEMPGNAAEALKAQAVASRTLALNALTRGGILKATTTEQVYGGIQAERLETNQAVDDTRGLILTYRGSLVQSPLFFSTCGGKTEASRDVFGKDLPYLQTVVDSDSAETASFCRASPYFEWTVRWTEEQLEKNMQPFGVSGKILDLIPAQVDDNGRVSRLSVNTTGGSWSFKGTTVRSVLRQPDGKLLDSTWFSLSKEVKSGVGDSPHRDSPRQDYDGETVFTAAGKGKGHGVGLCQWGAIGMAQAGKSFQEILTHYYQGVQITSKI